MGSRARSMSMLVNSGTMSVLKLTVMAILSVLSWWRLGDCRRPDPYHETRLVLRGDL
jgi:hypothetical protein